jgi:hypothetical protein
LEDVDTNEGINSLGELSEYQNSAKQNIGYYELKEITRGSMNDAQHN